MTWGGWSASSIGRLLGCPASFALPQARETGDQAVRGNILHDFCRTIQVNPEARAQALLDIEDEKIRATAAGINLAEALDGITVVALERAYVLNVEHRTVRVVGDNLNRKYGPLTKYDVPCTMDVVGTVLDGVPCELDYKSGRSIGKVEDHWQRRVCAAVLMIHYDAPSSIGRVGYIWEDGSIHADGGEFSCLDVDDWCDQIKAAIDKVDEAKAILATQVMPPVTADDDNCKYCPALTSCPHHMNFVRSLMGELIAIEKGPSLNTVSLETLGKAFDLFKKAEKILKVIETAGKLAGAEAPLPISDTHEYSTRWQTGKVSFDGARARGEIVMLMSKAGATEEEIAAKLASLNGRGPEYAVFSKTKRVLPVIQEEEKKAS